MQLTSLEIKGFKSFADKQIIHFNHNVTGIVGPNGCGKSNVVDAIRWVLGEQRSRALRSEKMDNLIFNGNKIRKASGRAEVNLTFENTRNLLPTEYQTVTISRVLYRNGDSEYRLNNVTCRLKDIQALFMDTGISSDSYAIIELNMISEILNDRDNLRRKLFEQAAGISKYKIRKKETLSKLEGTSSDLERVEDLLAEIENNLKTLEKQAKRAEKYKKIRAEYKDKSVVLALLSVREHKEQEKYVQQKLQNEETVSIETQTQIAHIEANISEKKTNIIAQEQELARAQRALNEHFGLIKEQENAKGIANEKLRYLQERKQSISQQRQQDVENLRKIEAELRLLQQRLQQEQHNLSEISEELKQANEQNKTFQDDFKTHKEALQHREKNLNHINQQLNQIGQNLAIQKNSRQSFEREASDNQKRITEKEKELNTLVAEQEKWEKEHQLLQQNIAQAQTAENQLSQKLSDLQQLIQNQKNTLQENLRQLDARKNEFTLTKSLVDSLEGFPESIKYLSKNKNTWSSGNEPSLLSDIISCPDTYKAALETLLAPYLNYFVVANKQEAQNAIQLLQQEKKGKSSFFVLENIAEKTHTETNTPPNTTPLLQVVQCENKYRPLVESLLYKTAFAEDAAQVETLQKNNPNWTFLSADGQIIWTKNSITGGFTGSFEGKKMGRAYNLKKIAADIEKIEQQVLEQKNTLAENEAAHKDLQNSSQKNQLQQWQNEFYKIENKLTSVKTAISNLSNFLQDNNDRNTALMEKTAGVNTQIESLQTSFDQWQQKQNDAREEFESFRQSFLQTENQANAQNKSFNELNIKHLHAQNQANQTRQNIEFYQSRQSEIVGKNTSNQTLIEQSEIEINNLQAQLGDKDTYIKNLYVQKDEFTKVLQQKEQHYFDEKGKIDALEQNLKQFQRKKEQHLAIISELKEQLNQLKIKMLSVNERLSVEFNIDLDSLPPIDYISAENIQKIGEYEETVQKLRRQIETFGEVNPFAIEAFNEMKKRHDFIIEQRNDLLQSKKSLLDTMQEIENTAVNLFMDAFNQVRDNFQKVFRKLFTEEDQCDLTLTNPDDPLESAVEIIAKPKGKKPSTIDQLSGGEKSLTAISLIFGLYLLKPAPFCILDEVDAPLDDVNVEKFSQMIREFSDNSQFIVITHNKNTMVSVDVVYGIVAQDGVSRAVPVDLHEIEYTNEKS